MKAPKLRGPFRNVRTAPRTFSFKSRHLPDVRPEWEQRKRRVEAEVLGSDAPRTIQFRQGGKDAAGRAARREASIRARRMAALRAAGIAAALVYLTYRAVLWLEAKDYGTFLDFMQSQG